MIQYVAIAFGSLLSNCNIDWTAGCVVRVRQYTPVDVETNVKWHSNHVKPDIKTTFNQKFSSKFRRIQKTQ